MNHPIIESQAQYQQSNFLTSETSQEDPLDDLEIQILQNQKRAQDLDWQQEGNVIINNIHLGMVRIEDSFFSLAPTISSYLTCQLQGLTPLFSNLKLYSKFQSCGLTFFRCFLIHHLTLSGQRNFYKHNSPL